MPKDSAGSHCLFRSALSGWPAGDSLKSRCVGVSSQALIRGWGDSLLRERDRVEAAFSEALGSPQPPPPGGLGGPDGPALAVQGKEMRAFLRSEAVRAVCGGDVGLLVAVMDEWDAVRAGSVTLHDLRVALRAVIPLKPMGGAPRQARQAPATPPRRLLASPQ